MQTSTPGMKVTQRAGWNLQGKIHPQSPCILKPQALQAAHSPPLTPGALPACLMEQRKRRREVQRLLPPVDAKWRPVMMPSMLNIVGQTYILSQPPCFFFFCFFVFSECATEMRRQTIKRHRCLPCPSGWGSERGVGKGGWGWGRGVSRVDTQSCGFSDSLIDLLYLSSSTRLPVRIKEFVLSNLDPEREKESASRITRSRNVWKTGASQPRVSGLEV